MNVIVTLKQLRRDPREYIRLLKGGYEVEITEHRKTIVKAIQSPNSPSQTTGDVATLLHAIEKAPILSLVDPKLDTVAAVKKARRQQVQRKHS